MGAFERGLEVFGDVLGCGDEAAVDDGAEAFSEQFGDDVGRFGELGVVGRAGELVRVAEEAVQSAEVVVLERGGGIVERRGWREVGGLVVVRGVEDLALELVLGGRFGIVGRGGGFVPFFERGAGGCGAGEDGAEDGDRAPVADALALFGRVGDIDVFAEVAEDIVEKFLVRGRHEIRAFIGDADGEGSFAAVPVFEVGALALDEVAGEIVAEEVALGIELGRDQAEQGAEGFVDAAVRGGGAEDDVAPGNSGEVAGEVVALLLRAFAARAGGGVGLVDDDQVGRVVEEGAAVLVGFGVVDADDEVGVMAVEGNVGRDGAFERGDAGGLDDGGIDMEFIAEFVAPLLAEVGRAEDSDAADDAAVEQFAGDHRGLDGLANADVIGDEQADGVEFERHQERDELVGAGLDGEFAERAEGAGAAAEAEADGVAEEQCGAERAGAFGVGRLVLGGLEGPRFERFVDAGGVRGGRVDGAELDDAGFVREGREDDPGAFAGFGEGAGRGGCGSHARGNLKGPRGGEQVGRGGGGGGLSGGEGFAGVVRRFREGGGEAPGEGFVERGADVDFGDAEFGGGDELGLGHAGCAVEDEGDVDGVEDGGEAVALEAAGGRAAVDVADGDGEPVDVGGLDELGGLGRVGPSRVADGDAVLVAGDVAEFGFERDAVPSGEAAGLAHELDVVVEGEGGAVDHEGIEAGVDGGGEFGGGVGVVEVEGGPRAAAVGERIERLEGAAGDGRGGFDAADLVEAGAVELEQDGLAGGGGGIEDAAGHFGRGNVGGDDGAAGGAGPCDEFAGGGERHRGSVAGARRL